MTSSCLFFSTRGGVKRRKQEGAAAAWRKSPSLYRLTKLIAIVAISIDVKSPPSLEIFGVVIYIGALAKASIPQQRNQAG